jgi:hypothetical protein
VPGWLSEPVALGINALLGGVAAGVARELTDGEFLRGFVDGVLGGGVHFVGKKIAAQQFEGAGLVGRQVGAVGSSMVLNAAAGRGRFEQLVFPVGPVRLHVRPGPDAEVVPKLDLVGAAVLAYAIVEPDLVFQPGESLSAGAVVYRTTGGLLVSPWDGEKTCGSEVGGVVLLSRLDHLTPLQERTVFAHERMHVLQNDFLFTVLGDPLVDALASRISGGPQVLRHIGINVGDVVFEGAGRFLFRDYARRPWEIEADFLTRRR